MERDFDIHDAVINVLAVASIVYIGWEWSSSPGRDGSTAHIIVQPALPTQTLPLPPSPVSKCSATTVGGTLKHFRNGNSIIPPPRPDNGFRALDVIPQRSLFSLGTSYSRGLQKWLQSLGMMGHWIFMFMILSLLIAMLGFIVWGASHLFSQDLKRRMRSRAVSILLAYSLQIAWYH